jgi:hypothetical protein
MPHNGNISLADALAQSRLAQVGLLKAEHALNVATAILKKSTAVLERSEALLLRHTTAAKARLLVDEAVK